MRKTDQKKLARHCLAFISGFIQARSGLGHSVVYLLECKMSLPSPIGEGTPHLRFKYGPGKQLLWL